MARTAFRRVLIAVFALVAALPGLWSVGVAPAGAYTARPRVDAVSARYGPTTGGTRVVLRGYYLETVTAVYFGGARATHLVLKKKDDNSLTVTAPAHTAGQVHVYAVNAHGRSAAAWENHYVYSVLPHVTSISPSSGDIAGGSTVYIHGDHLTTADGVFFGGSHAQQVHVSATVIRVVLPRHARGLVHLYFQTRWTERLPTAPHVLFRYTALPSLTAAPSPGYSSAEGGQTITLTGERLTSSTMVTFGGVRGQVIGVGRKTLSVRTPPHAVGSVDVRVGNADGTAPSAYVLRYQPPAALSFLAPEKVDTASLADVSCARVDYCVAADDPGKAQTWDGTTWTQPEAIDGSQSISAVTCASGSSFCAAATYSGLVMVFSDGAWSTATQVDRELTGIECPTATFCLALGRSDHVWNGSSWSTTDAGTPLVEASCPSATMCIATGEDGAVYRFDGSAWSVVTSAGRVSSYNALGCASPTYCLVVDQSGLTSVLDGDRWSLTSQPADLDLPHAVRCVNRSDAMPLCVLVGHGMIETFDGQDWSAPRGVAAPDGTPLAVRQVACASATECKGVTDNGYVVTGR